MTQIIKEGAEYYLKSTTIKDLERCLVVLTEGKKLQLELTTSLEADYLRFEL